jgi:hypothetical protein
VVGCWVRYIDQNFISPKGWVNEISPKGWVNSCHVFSMTLLSTEEENSLSQAF